MLGEISGGLIIGAVKWNSYSIIFAYHGAGSSQTNPVSLLSTGKISGFTGHYISNVESNSAWAGDPRNIVFLPNGPSGGDHLNSLQVHRGNY
ncbi:hypothetical protein [Burkholderia sp. Bp8998]|uniref:hypothetical protein n=1 Tax=Burkholderia sp. Bp8998 TaxID=2184557 RepID=UPI000F5AAC67|nr:hypothetical protein DIE06_16810 [Burkholderia sp. Bp8998]